MIAISDRNSASLWVLGLNSWLEDFAFHIAFLGLAFLVAGLICWNHCWNYVVVPIAESSLADPSESIKNEKTSLFYRLFLISLVEKSKGIFFEHSLKF